MPELDYEFDRSIVENTLRDLATLRLEGSYTVSITAWEDTDFHIEAYHTINERYPEMARAVDTDGLPYYREQLVFETTGSDAGWIRHEVVRQYTGMTSSETIYSERVGGYTPNWPAPLEDNDNTQEDTPSYPGSTYPGRFA